MAFSAASGDDNDYFTNYEDIAVHNLMLKDRPRTLAYMNFIEQNVDLIKDKIVMDVGAGTGILSLFAAKFGARKVYAVEASGLAALCKTIVAGNNLDDVIEVINNRVEDIELPNDVKIDVIISEWMGIYLLHESMLNSLLVARDRWLAPDGILLPSTANLYFCPITMPDYYKENIQFWNDVYGFDFSSAVPFVKQAAMRQPLVEVIKAEQCIAEPQLVVSLDLQFVTSEDFKKIESMFDFNFTKNSVLHGFACWFDVVFEGKNEITLSTGPESPATHWKQTVIILPESFLVSKEGSIRCQLGLQQDEKNPRTYSISVAVPDLDDDCGDNDDDNQADIDGEDNVAIELVREASKQ